MAMAILTLPGLRGWLWWDSTLIDIKSPASDARHPVHRGNEPASVRVICEINFPETSHLYFRMEGGFPFSIQTSWTKKSKKGSLGKLARLKLFWAQYLKWILSCCIKWVAAAAAKQNIAWVWNIKLTELPSRV